MAQNNSQNIVEELVPSTKTIDIAPLLNNIDNFISDRTVLPDGASTAITLWCVATYGIDLFNIFPRLTIISPEKRCGKSTVLDLVEAFSHKSLFTSNISPAGVFRLINECQPTLIIDEADTFIARGSSEMTGIINSGHAKNRAFVSRCVGDTHKVERFSTWTPLALAAIGTLPSTIMDRSIVIPLRRKTNSETILRIQPGLHVAAESTRCDLLKWMIDHHHSIKKNTIEPPNLGNDRAVDNWLSLFTIANQVGPEWLDKCEASYRLLNDYEDEPLLSTQLLADIRDIFSNHNSGKISSADLVAKLVAFKDKPWCEIKGGRSMSQNGLATMLKVYDIKPKGIRINGVTPRGYEIDQFNDAFKRYLPSP